MIKKIALVSFLILSAFNQALAQGNPCYAQLICQDTAIVYDANSRWCNDGYLTLSRWYRINVNSTLQFHSFWSTSNCNMTSFEVYGPFMSFDYNNSTICENINNNVYTPYYSAGGGAVTNISFSTNYPSNTVWDGTYLIHIDFDNCAPVLSIDLDGVWCGPIPGTVLPAMPGKVHLAFPRDTTTPPAPCDTCTSFKPYVGRDYWLSAWVKEDHASQVKNYADTYVELGFTGSGVVPLDFHTTGEIIDGWQRIVGKFKIPSGTTDLKIDLVNDSGGDAYFDDIRIHPFNGNMKSYVYDAKTFLLMAELDDNNYATVYEYDKEGGLVRVKKETSRGIVTIQETRSNKQKEDHTP